MPTQETKSPSKTRNPKLAVPAYRQRAGYSQAIVTLTDAETRQRRDYWLGEFDQPESRERYHRVIAEWERRGRRLPPPEFDAPPARRADEITIVEVIREYWRWAADYYRPKHAQALDGALTILRQFYGRTAAIDFGPKKLRLLRDHMIRGDGSRRMPWSRKYINSQVQRIRHMFKWAAGHELVPVAVHQSLCTLEALRRGRCDAREGKKVAPVPQHLLEAVLPNLTRPVAALVRLQLLSGARAGELLGMRPCDIEIDEKLGVWTYKPEGHKNAYREHERVIYFGPQAQEVIRPFLRNRATNAFLFSPAESDKERRERQHAERKTPKGQGNEPGTNRRENPRRKPGDRFTTSTYHRAIQYACDRTFPPPQHLAKRDDETTDAWRDRLEAEELWDEFVAWRKAHRFIAHFRLDAEQSRKAWAHHAECLKGVRKHEKDHEVELKSLLEQIGRLEAQSTRTAEQETELSRARSRVDVLRGNTEKVFEERLKPGLAKIPTQAQIDAARAREREAARAQESDAAHNREAELSRTTVEP